MNRFLVRSALGALAAAAAPAALLHAQPYTTPTKEHEQMAHEVGVWDAEVTMWETPDAEPMKSKAVETNKLLGKMWLMSEFEGQFGDTKFSGRSALGYDPIKKKYVGGWVDTISPFMTSMEGEYDVATHTLTMMGHGVNCFTGKEEQTKMITRYNSEDDKVFEIHMPVEGQEGKWWKSMEVKYKRRK
jgi:hypothetical protein